MAVVDGGGGCHSHLIVLESLLAGVHTWQYVPEVVMMVRKNADGDDRPSTPSVSLVKAGLLRSYEG